MGALSYKEMVWPLTWQGHGKLSYVFDPLKIGIAHHVILKLDCGHIQSAFDRFASSKREWADRGQIRLIRPQQFYQAKHRQAFWFRKSEHGTWHDIIGRV